MWFSKTCKQSDLETLDLEITLLNLISLFLCSWISTLQVTICDRLQFGIVRGSTVPVLAIDSFSHG